MLFQAKVGLDRFLRLAHLVSLDLFLLVSARSGFIRLLLVKRALALGHRIDQLLNALAVLRNGLGQGFAKGRVVKGDGLANNLHGRDHGLEHLIDPLAFLTLRVGGSAPAVFLGHMAV